jgi:hypothetical protein
MGLFSALALIAALLSLLVFMPWRVELSAEARAEPDGHWAAAGGVALGPFALSGVGARGVPVSIHVYAFGRRKYTRALAAEDEPQELSEGDGSEAEAPATPPRAGRVRRFFSRRFDPIDAVAWLLSEHRRLRFEVDHDLDYSFRDVALTGKLLGGIYVLLPLLPQGIRLRQRPSWESVDRGALQATGSLKIFAGLVLCDLIWYMLKVRLLPRRSAPLRERPGT